MKRFAFILLILVPTSIAYANPCIQSPTSFAATIVVVITGLLLEIFITTGVLIFTSMALGPTFLVLVLGNIGSYLGVFSPLAYYFEVHIALVEVAVIAMEAAFIKLTSVLAVFQQDTFIGLEWRYALLTATSGNVSSYDIGTLLV